MSFRVSAFVLSLAGAALLGCGAEMGTPQGAPQPSMGNPVSMGIPQGVPQTPPTATGGAVVPSLPGPTTDDSAMDEDEDEALGFAQNPSEDGVRERLLGPTATSPVLALSDAEIEHRFHHDLASLGPASVGPASAGALLNGVQMPESPYWQLTDPGRAWGTQETVDALTRCIERVNQRLPGAPRISIGHLSARTGGHLSPHRSHQSGRDADVGYYYRAGIKPFIHATAENLDLPRTWALVKTAVRETTVEMILIDHAVQRVLADYAASAGEDQAFLDEVFQVRGKNARAVIRHVKGHDNHIHFRFHNPVAEAVGRRVARFVVVPRVREAPSGARVASGSSPGSPEAAPVYAQIRARSGDTLVILARRYGTTVEDIQHANGLSGNAIRAGMVYKIPQRAPPPGVARAVPSPRLAKAPARVAARKSRKPGLRTPAAAVTKPKQP